MNSRSLVALAITTALGGACLTASPLMAQEKQDTPTAQSRVTATATAPAATVTVTATPTPKTTEPRKAEGPSSEAINKGIMTDETREIFSYISAAIALLAGLIQMITAAVKAIPGAQDKLKSMLK